MSLTDTKNCWIKGRITQTICQIITDRLTQATKQLGLLKVYGVDWSCATTGAIWQHSHVTSRCKSVTTSKTLICRTWETLPASIITSSPPKRSLVSTTRRFMYVQKFYCTHLYHVGRWLSDNTLLLQCYCESCVLRLIIYRATTDTVGVCRILKWRVFAGWNCEFS